MTTDARLSHLRGSREPIIAVQFSNPAAACRISEDGPHAFVTELDAGPTSPEDLYKVAGMFIVLAERLTQVLAAETTR